MSKDKENSRETPSTGTSTFRELGLSADLLQVVDELGYTTLTPIQAQSIPALLKGRDLIGQSRTGSGKTAAFTLPVLQKIQLQRRVVQALVLCPTRELCTQVAREMRKLGRRHQGLQVLIVAGGQFAAPQISALEKGVHIVVGTPGRVLDLLGRNKLNIDLAKTIILDEADRMLDMGFEEAMQQILAALPTKRQTVFFSATYPASIAELSQRYQTNPLNVTIADESGSNKDIEQVFYQTPHDQRLDALKQILEAHDARSVIVFSNLKAVAREVAAALATDGISAESIHGDLEQYERDRVMAKFRNQTTRVLVATDVAARGLDIEQLDLVVNYDTPAKPDVYVHRIGRTGRAGRQGVAVSLISPRENYKMELIAEYTKSKPRLSDLRFLAPQKKQPTEESPTPVLAPAEMVTVCIFGGRKDKLRPGDILGALTGDAGGLAGTDIGKIEIHDRLAYVAIRKNIAKKALESLQKGRIKGRTFKISLVE